jgi:DNA polymerase I
MPIDLKPTLLLIDGHSLAFRAFYALNPENFKTQDGQYTNAVHGFISMLLSLIESEKPTHICVAFDVSRESFRTLEYPDYKGNRGETPEEFIGQTELLVEALAAMRITSVSREGFEADDLIASLARLGETSGMDVLIVSGDRDTFQLISDKTTVLYPVKGVMNLSRMNDSAVLEKYGVNSKQYQDLAALVGETSDNLPGIVGVGPKTAAKWLQAYGDLDGVLAAADQITGKVGENLREMKELAVRNRRLNNLIRDLEFEFGVDDLLVGPVNEDEVRAMFARLNFRTLLTRVIKLRGTNGRQIPVTKATVTEDEDELVKTQEQFESIEQPVSQVVSIQEIQSFCGEGVFVSVQFADNKLVGLGAANRKVRLDWDGHDSQAALHLLQSGNFGLFDSKKVIKHLLNLGQEPAEMRDDALLVCYLDDPTLKSYELEQLMRSDLGIELSKETEDELFTEQSPSLDAWAAAVLFETVAKRLEKKTFTDVYRAIELPSSRVLAKMEVTGIAIDKANLVSQFEDLSSEAEQIAKQAYEIIGHEVNLASPKQLQVVLFEELGFQGTRSVKTGYSTNAEALADLLEQTGHPFLEKLLAHRDITKTKQMAETLLQSIQLDGRIHTSYLQTGTTTGRLSSENPNLQNIPIKTQKGQRLRSAFVAGSGFVDLLTADYSQIEMRIMAHLSEDAGLIEAFRAGEDLHNYVGSRIYGVAPSEVDSAMRSKVKAMSYGLVYGLSEFGLARQLKISKSEAKQLMADYFARFGGVKRYLDNVVQRARVDGFTETVYGRRRPFADLNSKVFQIRENARRAALNAPIQGTAADIMKLAMIHADKRLEDESLKSRLLLQVHDELVFEIAPGELEQVRLIAIESMKSVARLSVPVEVHVGVGPNWELAGH